MTLTDLSTKDLIEGMTALLGTERQAVARLVAYLAEIDARGAYLDAAYSSLQDFCQRKLGLSEGEAFRRINAARLVRRFPVIVEMIEAGSIHLTALVALRDYLTDANHLELLRDASKKTKTELAAVLAARFPRPDVAASIHEVRVGRTLANAGSAAVEPLSMSRYRVELTVDAALKEKLERAADLMGQRHPRDLAAVMTRAVDLLIGALEKERFGKTERPAKERKAKHGRITRAVRREVWARDEERCAFVSETGERCPARTHLQYDHCFPRALGGSGKARNVRLLCRAHNLREAERVFGKKAIADRIRLRQRKRSASAARAGSIAESTEPLASKPARIPSPHDDEQRPTTIAAESPFDVVERALRTMGFRSTEARVAVSEVRAIEVERRSGASLASDGEPTVENVLRAALAVLHRDRMQSVPQLAAMRPTRHAR